MPRTIHLNHSAVLAAVVTSAFSAGVAAGDAEAAQPHTKAGKVRVEFAVTADRAVWTPDGRGPERGRLRLDRLEPKMAIMAVAPRRELSIAPASMLAANWKALFGAQRGWTNAVLSARVGGRPALYPIRIKLARHALGATRVSLQVKPLKRLGHSAPRLSRAATLENPTLLIDPVVDHSMKALWHSVNDLGADAYTPLGNPTSSDGSVFTNPDGEYAGPRTTTRGVSIGNWTSFEIDLLEDALDRSIPTMAKSPPDVPIEFGAVDGVALFDHGFGDVTLAYNGAGSPLSMRNLAIFDARVQNLRFDTATVDRANLRGTSVEKLDVANSGFDGVDMSGASFGGADARSTVKNAVFSDVVTRREVVDAAGVPDNATKDRAGLKVSHTDFASTSFQNADFRGATFESATFRGCGFNHVDFQSAQVDGDVGTYTDAGGNDFQELEPTFTDAILEDVTFDGARLSNVSFAGVDFSNGVLLDGAVLNNVDFTGAVGLQNVDWSRVTVEGPVFGLGAHGNEIANIEDPNHLRSLSFDGRLPSVDPATGFDVQPDTGYLIDPSTGVRLDRVEGEGLVPVDPFTGQRMTDPRSGDDLAFDGREVFNPRTNEAVRIDYESGRPE